MKAARNMLHAVIAKEVNFFIKFLVAIALLFSANG
jgi:hypothetical protein